MDKFDEIIKLLHKAKYEMEYLKEKEKERSERIQNQYPDLENLKDLKLLNLCSAKKNLLDKLSDIDYLIDKKKEEMQNKGYSLEDIEKRCNIVLEDGKIYPALLKETLDEKELESERRMNISMRKDGDLYDSIIGLDF